MTNIYKYNVYLDVENTQGQLNLYTRFRKAYMALNIKLDKKGETTFYNLNVQLKLYKYKNKLPKIDNYNRCIN